MSDIIESLKSFLTLHRLIVLCLIAVVLILLIQSKETRQREKTNGQRWHDMRRQNFDQMGAQR